MYIQPGQDAISWEQFLHIVIALQFITSKDAATAMQLTYNDLMDHGIGIFCSLADHAKHAETITEETLAALRELGGL